MATAGRGIGASIGVALALAACSVDPDGVGGGGFADGGGIGGDTDDTDADGDEVDDDDGAGEGSSGGAEASDDGDDGADAGDGGDDGAGSSDGGSSGGEDPPPSDDGGPGPDVGACSSFASVEAFFAYVNDERGQYGGMFGTLPHVRYKGLPWQGESHEDFTFSTIFSWDDGLAAQAQAQADAIAAGSAPSGTQSTGSNGLPLCSMSPMWIDGLNTASWSIALGETPADWNPPASGSCPPTTFALSPDNQHARMGLFYHDFGGDGPAIHRLGVGAALEHGPVDGECRVWWVLQFGP